jgi:hypothetical protein
LLLPALLLASVFDEPSVQEQYLKPRRNANCMTTSRRSGCDM